MGDLRDCSGMPNGVVAEDRPSPCTNPDPSLIVEDTWEMAEKTTQELVRWIHPTLDSEEKRKDVIEYIQRLTRFSLGVEVFPYGSVPLKTYLPDGDIDLTALISPVVEETLPADVLSVLQAEELNENAEYEVKDTQFIDAEVKLVKCLVQNIVIDISFNQLGGLCTLCFLEQVDRLVGKDHLFKRSIILIKAWCYYESRILGAHHGLISTYALETLVLYIFHLFHSSLNGPLAVLYRFLDYFSKFDWENYCISLKGPVCKSSLPDIVAEMPENLGANLLLSEEFLRNCIEMFSAPSRGHETDLRTFNPKHLNIIDPLKENNNLGRSVHRGNFYRIRSAFKYGARKLGHVLVLPRQRIPDEIKKFFANTLERHGRKSSKLPSSLSRAISEEALQLNSVNLDFDSDIPVIGDNELDGCSVNSNPMHMVSKIENITSDELDGYSVNSNPMHMVSKIENITSDCSISSSDLSNSLCGRLSACAPDLYLFGPSENGPENAVDEKIAFDLWMAHRENCLASSNAVSSCSNNSHEGVSSTGSGISTPDGTTLESIGLDFREMDLVDIVGSPDTLNPLSDLSGDYDSHIRSLLYGQCCHGYALSVPILPNPPTFPSQFQRPWETVHHNQYVSSPTYTNGVVLGSIENPKTNSALPNSALCLEEKHKLRGTGTYIPNSNGCECREKSTQGKRRNQGQGNHRPFQRHTRSAGCSAWALRENKFFEDISHDPPNGKAGLSHKSIYASSDDSLASGFSKRLLKLEFGSLGNLAEENYQAYLDACHAPVSTPIIIVAPDVQTPRAASGNYEERVEKQLFHLKDEEDFPPLAT
ncbi:Polynucleotide adenylyltransferase [Bertholletia excelsa]